MKRKYRLEKWSMIILLIFLSGCWLHWEKMAKKRSFKDQTSRVEKYDSLGYAKINLAEFRFDTVNNERWISSGLYKYRIINNDKTKIFEYYTFHSNAAYKRTFHFYFSDESPDSFYCLKYNWVNIEESDSKKQKDVDTIEFNLTDQKTFRVGSTNWTIFKFVSQTSLGCNTLYFNGSLGVVKSYSPKQDNGRRELLECETQFLDGQKEYIVESILNQFYGIDNFHTRCDGGLRYLNGSLMR